MWKTTGDVAALSDFESREAKFNSGTTTYVDADFDWSNVKNLSMYLYLLSKRPGRTATTAIAIQAGGAASERIRFLREKRYGCRPESSRFGRPCGDGVDFGLHGHRSRMQRQAGETNRQSAPAPPGAAQAATRGKRHSASVHPVV